MCGYDEKRRRVVVADPFRENPLSKNNYYKVSLARLINAIMLGAQTYDATMLMITPKEEVEEPQKEEKEEVEVEKLKVEELKSENVEKTKKASKNKK